MRCAKTVSSSSPGVAQVVAKHMSGFFVLCSPAVCPLALLACGGTSSFIFSGLVFAELAASGIKMPEELLRLWPIYVFMFAYIQEHGIGDKSSGFGDR